MNKPTPDLEVRFAFMGIFRFFGFFVLSLVLMPQLLTAYFKPGDQPQRAAILFHRYLSRLLDIKLRVHGEVSTARPTLYVSNHSSYLDVPVLGALIPSTFVAKSEVKSWPFIGFMCKLQNTAFIQRRAADLTTQSDDLRQRLEAHRGLILFPEGTSSDGTRTLPFKSSLFSIVEKPLADGTSVTVQPVTTVCTELGGLPIGRIWRPYYAWYGDMTFMRHLWNVFCMGHFTVDVVFHPPVLATSFPNRKALADYCQKQAAKGVELCITGRINQPKTLPSHKKKQLAPPAPDLAQTGA